MAETTSRLKIALPLIAMLVLFAAWSGWWWWASQFAREQFTEARANASEQIELTCANEAWRGYPYRIMFTCQDATIALKRQHMTIRSAKLDILVQAYNPSHIIARLTGPSEIDNPRQAVLLSAEHLPSVTGVKLKNGRFDVASTQIKALILKAGGTVVLTAKDIALHARPAAAPRPGFDFALNTGAIQFAPAAPQPIAFDLVTAEANIDRWPAGAATNLTAFAHAAAAIGTLFTLDNLNVSSSGITATASGNVIINRAGGLTGALKTKIQNLNQLLGDLTKRGVITESQAKTSATLLGLFKTAEGVAADLRFKDGEVYWGPLKLGRHVPLF